MAPYIAAIFPEIISRRPVELAGNLQFRRIHGDKVASGDSRLPTAGPGDT
jgi:hypothetical protein